MNRYRITIEGKGPHHTPCNAADAEKVGRQVVEALIAAGQHQLQRAVFEEVLEGDDGVSYINPIDLLPPTATTPEEAR